ncbi:flippase activity-associated protein Agl23 [Candidatus Amarolinea dominans]|uniref:flippase activity-associated protein Agl23 n=1 Tax=Candidatus Amarolinea dominans TaxID=3140696 RepID=UPI0031CC8F97
MEFEKTAWALLLILAVVTHLYMLGVRAMSHDESLHVLYSWKLYDGQGYQHQPMMHGPFRFHINALGYALFGVNDAVGRLPAAVAGIATVWLLWFFRSYLGRLGAFLAATMFAISPAILYYTRYIRDESFMLLFLVWLILMIFRYFDTREPKYLIVMMVPYALMFTSMEISYIFAGLFIGFFLLYALLDIARDAWSQDALKIPFFVALAASAVAAVYSFYRVTRGEVGVSETGAIIVFFLGVALLATALYLAWRGVGERLHTHPALDVVIWLLAIAAPLFSAFIIRMFGWDPQDYSQTGYIRSLGVFLVMLVAAGAVGALWGRVRWLIGAGVFYVIYILLFTTFFTNGQGIATGAIGSLGYWLAQQEVARGGQPLYYYLLTTPMYEFLPLFLTLGGIVAFITGRGWRFLIPKPEAEGKDQRSEIKDRVHGRRTISGLRTEIGDQRAEIGYVEDENAPLSGLRSPVSGLRSPVSNPQSSVSNPQSPISGLRSPVSNPQSPVSGLRSPTSNFQSLFTLFNIWWFLGAFGGLTWAGEKMPWLTVYIALPMTLMGGWWAGRVLERIEWGAWRKQGGLWLLLSLPVMIFALTTLAQSSPFQNVTIAGLSTTLQWLAALAMLLALAWLAVGWIRNLGRQRSGQTIFLALALALGLWTVRVSYMFNYIHFDDATELLVYAHATPDIKRAMNEIAEISERTVGGKQIKVAYDDDSTWPLEWYLREYPNRSFYGASPNRDALDAPVVLVGDKNEDKVKPYLGSRYVRYSYRLVWWPKQTYFGLTWQRIRDGLRDPQQRKVVWDVLWYRKYTQPLSEWDPVHRFSMYVRKDVVTSIWQYGAVAASGDITDTVAAVDPYEKGVRQVTSLRQWGGAEGEANGQFRSPRNVATAPDGSLYVADTGNHRIQQFDASGNFVRQWGGQGAGNGQFNEPWGVAVAPDGKFVYVCDTWNHRIQKFSAEGTFVKAWGANGVTDGQLGQQGVFWGPRAVAIDGQGRVYVTDTGNKRVQVFDADGSPVGQFGGAGLVDGALDEPVGLAIDKDGNIYLADTWNKRVQVFSKDFKYLRQWPVEGWPSQSVVNKPYLAVADTANGRRVYVTDPEYYRVLIFDDQGKFIALFGQYGNQANEMTLPTGIAVDAQGQLFVADPDSHRVILFPAVN